MSCCRMHPGTAPPNFGLQLHQWESLLERTEMRMVKWIIGVSMIQRLECEMKRMAKLCSIKEKAREARKRLRYLVHVLRRGLQYPVKRAYEEQIRGWWSINREKLRTSWRKLWKRKAWGKMMQQREIDGDSWLDFPTLRYYGTRSKVAVALVQY